MGQLTAMNALRRSHHQCDGASVSSTLSRCNGLTDSSADTFALQTFFLHDAFPHQTCADAGECWRQVLNFELLNGACNVKEMGTEASRGSGMSWQEPSAPQRFFILFTEFSLEQVGRS